MKHIILIIYLFSITSGLSIIIFALFIYQKYKIKIILFFLAIILCVSLNIIYNAYFHYSTLNYLGKIDINILRYIILSNNLVFIFCFPVLVLNLFSKLSFKKTVFISLANIGFYIILFFLSVLDHFFHLSISFEKIIKISHINMFITVMIYSIILLIKNKAIKNKIIKGAVKLYFILLVLFAPGLFCQTLTPINYGFKINHFFEIFNYISLPLFYMIWNLSNLALYINFSLKHRPLKSTLFLERIKEFQITKRESEIIQLLLKGAKYREIGTELYISLETVKTHLNNIYRKTNTRNKLELYNLMKQEL